MANSGAWATHIQFVFLPSFERTAQGLLDDEAMRELERTLLRDPRAGPALKGGSGVRKIRTGVEGRGKRGGARVLYLYIEARQKIYFLLCYPKNEQENLTPEQTRRIRELVAQLEAQE